MASKILVDELAPYSHATDVTLATGKKITGDNTQFKITGGASTNVLTTDGSGALTWGAIAAGFDGVHSDTTSGSETYEVPPGVTKLIVIQPVLAEVVLQVRLVLLAGVVMLPLRLLLVLRLLLWTPSL